MVKESPPRRPISVAVQEKVFVVLNPFAAWTINPIRPRGGGGGGSEARMTKLTADNQKPLTL